MTLAVNLAQGASNNVTFRNKLINGAMVIDQRNAGASLAITTNAQYSVDRFAGSVYSSGTGRYSLQQSTTVPAGFTNSLKMTVTTADASPTADYGYALQQSIEGLNCTDLNWGSANASTVTLSFWVYSSVTGNLPVVLLNSGFTRYYATTYSVASANTWTKISLTIVGDTSGTWLTTNGGGIYINFGFGAGSNRTASTANAWSTSAYGGNLTSVTGATSVIATNGATWYVTGVQLEVGTVASSFEYRPYGLELSLCQRYFEKFGINQRQFWTSNGQMTTKPYSYKATKRATPTVTISNAYTTDGWTSYTVEAHNTPSGAYDPTNILGISATSSGSSNTIAQLACNITSDAEL